MTNTKTNFKVSLDLDIVLDDDGLVPDVVVRNIAITQSEVERHRYMNEQLEDGEKDE